MRHNYSRAKVSIAVPVCTAHFCSEMRAEVCITDSVSKILSSSKIEIVEKSKIKSPSL